MTCLCERLWDMWTNISQDIGTHNLYQQTFDSWQKTYVTQMSVFSGTPVSLSLLWVLFAHRPCV